MKYAPLSSLCVGIFPLKRGVKKFSPLDSNVVFVVVIKVPPTFNLTSSSPTFGLTGVCSSPAVSYSDLQSFFFVLEGPLVLVRGWGVYTGFCVAGVGVDIGGLCPGEVLSGLLGRNSCSSFTWRWNWGCVIDFWDTEVCLVRWPGDSTSSSKFPMGVLALPEWVAFGMP